MERRKDSGGLKRVAVLTPAWAGTVGGTTKVAANLVNGIRQADPACAIQVITSDQVNNKDAQVVCTGNSMVCKILGTIAGLKRFRPQVIHVHGRIHYLLISYMYKLLCDMDTRLICSFYTQAAGQGYFGETATRPRETSREWIKKRISIFLLNRADCIVANSNSLSENLKRDLGPKLVNPVRVIPSGVEARDVSEESIEDFIRTFSLKGAYPIFVTVGVLQWEWKVAGMLILLKSFREVIREWPSSRLILVGDGQYRGMIEDNIAQLGLQRSVLMTGNVSNTFIPLGVSDIYCHMALNESCSVSILEAMMSGKPIIAASAGGNADLISDGETGILIEPGVESLKHAMLELAQNREFAAKLAHTAQIVARERYNWSVITQQYLRVYSD